MTSRDDYSLHADKCTAPSGGIGSETDPLEARSHLMGNQTVDVDELRSETRHPLEQTMTVMPVKADGTPDVNYRFSAVCRDLSASGIGIDLVLPGDVPSQNLVVCIDGFGGKREFACIDVRHTNRIQSGELRTGGTFGGEIQEVLDTQQIAPSFRPEAMEFEFDYSRPFLDTLTSVGMLDEVVLDQVQLCPKCRGLPTFRKGCRKCGSARYSADRLIHHFVCAHVGRLSEFETPEGLVCPKCLSRPIVVGADFEHLTGQYRCLDCHWADSELEHVGHCLRCGYRFSGEKSVIQDVCGFQANRMDPLAVVGKQ